MSKKLPRCEHCHRAFRPDRYNVHGQKFCTRDECVLERKRKRQREWQARRRAEDAAFRASENARCAEANRKRRARPREREPDREVSLTDVVTGLLSQLTETSDPVRLHASLLDYAARGRRVAAFPSTGTDPP